VTPDPAAPPGATPDRARDPAAAAACEFVAERLPLLRYADELAPDERLAVLAHLDRCPACRADQAALDAAAAALEVVPLRHPEAARLEGLRDRVLADVGAGGCPREADLLEPDAPHAGGLDLDAHLGGCAPCREARAAFAQVGAALDLVPLVPPGSFAAMRAAVFERTGAAAPATGADSTARRPSGRLLLLPSPRLLAAAAALLLTAGAFALGRLTAAPVDAGQAVALKQRADDLVRSANPRDRAALAAAISVYERLAAGEAGASAALADHELAALRELRSLSADGEVDYLDLKRVMVDHPDAPNTFACALREYRDQSAIPRPVVPVVGTTYSALTEAGGSGQPGPIDAPVRYCYSQLQLGEFEHALTWIVDWRVRQAIILEKGMAYEEMGDLTQARACYTEVVCMASDKYEPPARRIASERLARLGSS
jgi:hypothetical protein